MKMTILLSFWLVFILVMQASASSIDVFSAGAGQPLEIAEHGTVAENYSDAPVGALNETNAFPVKASLSIASARETGMIMMFGVGLLLLSGLIRKKHLMK